MIYLRYWSWADEYTIGTLKLERLPDVIVSMVVILPERNLPQHPMYSRVCVWSVRPSSALAVPHLGFCLCIASWVTWELEETGEHVLLVYVVS